MLTIFLSNTKLSFTLIGKKYINLKNQTFLELKLQGGQQRNFAFVNVMENQPLLGCILDPFRQGYINFGQI